MEILNQHTNINGGNQANNQRRGSLFENLNASANSSTFGMLIRSQTSQVFEEPPIVENEDDLSKSHIIETSSESSNEGGLNVITENDDEKDSFCTESDMNLSDLGEDPIDKPMGEVYDESGSTMLGDRLRAQTDKALQKRR